MASTSGSSGARNRGQKRRRNPDPYNTFGDGEYLGHEVLEETDEVYEEIDNLLNTPSECMYRSAFRMSPTAFESLLEFVKEDHVFFGVPQPPIKYQLSQEKLEG
ncbi:hypothetical protein RhiJN_25735 [Ceratobasidium sp. AG-Ba]|nr:hypothetical protein RhiJN_25735 [Ceratobasidium sp. AG-Ba]